MLDVADPAAAAGRFTRTIARAAQNRREHVRFPIDHVRFGVLALGDEADVLGNVGMGRTRPLAIHDFVEVRRLANIGRLHVERFPLKMAPKPSRGHQLL